jgi:hypothetical protein
MEEIIHHIQMELSRHSTIASVLPEPEYVVEVSVAEYVEVAVVIAAAAAAAEMH